MEPVKANILPDMFNKQKELIKHYIIIESLPEYPVDLNKKTGQKLIKDFVYRFTEELSEGYDELVEMNKLAQGNVTGKITADRVLQYNLEIADAWHFLLEIMIYMGIENELDNMVFSWVNDHPDFQGFYEEETPFGTLFKIAGAINFNSGIGKYDKGFDKVTIVSEKQAVALPIYSGGRVISSSELEKHGLLLWDVVNYFHRFTHKLNNRDWHKTEKELNHLVSKQSFVEALLSFAIYLEFALFTQQSIYHSYSYKNQINQGRIKNGY